MSTKPLHCFETDNYFEHYRYNIQAQLEEIDLYLKCEDIPLSTETVAGLLSITKDEVIKIRDDEQINDINTYTFYKIMEKGSSSICQMFRRELERGCPDLYEAHDISYIYGIEKETVETAFRQLGFKKIAPNILPLVFIEIPAPELE